MNKYVLTALLPLVLLPALTVAHAQQYVGEGTVFSVTKGEMVNQMALYTESNWERVVIPQDAAARLGGLNTPGALSHLTLSSAGLPNGVTVRLNGYLSGSLEKNQNSASSIGLNVSRAATSGNVNTRGTFTLTNTVSKESYSFTAQVIGSGR